MEALSQVEGLKEFVKSSRVGNKAFVAQHYAKKHGHFFGSCGVWRWWSERACCHTERKRW
jgi:hypothetical protein